MSGEIAPRKIGRGFERNLDELSEASSSSSHARTTAMAVSVKAGRLADPGPKIFTVRPGTAGSGPARQKPWPVGPAMSVPWWSAALSRIPMIPCPVPEILAPGRIPCPLSVTRTVR